MTTGILNLQPTVESQMKKLSQQKLRRKNAEAKASKVEDDEIEKDAIEMATPEAMAIPLRSWLRAFATATRSWRWREPT